MQNKTKTKIKRTSKRNALVLRTFKYENNDDRDLEEAHNPLPASELWVTEINIIRIWLRKLISKWKMRNKVVLISGMQIQVKRKNKLFELFGGTILNYDRNDDKHVYKNNSHDDDRSTSSLAWIYWKWKGKTTWKSGVNWQLQLISSGDRGKMCDKEKKF